MSETYITVREALKRWAEISNEGTRFALARFEDNPIIEIIYDEGSYYHVKLSSGFTLIRHGNTYVYPTDKPFRAPREATPAQPTADTPPAAPSETTEKWGKPSRVRDSDLLYDATDVAALQAISDGRLKTLTEKAEELRREWQRAENAESEAAALREQNAALVEALEFYANEENWGSDYDPVSDPHNDVLSAVEHDGGDKARAAIEAAKKGASDV